MRVDIIQGFQGGVATSGVFSLAQWWCWRGGGEGRRAAFGQAVLETVVSEGRPEESAFRLTCSLKRWCDGVGVAAVRWHFAQSAPARADVKWAACVALVGVPRKDGGVHSVASCRLKLA